MAGQWREHIVSTPDVLRGKPRIKGTRISVSLRFFADHCISNYLVDALRGAGHDVLRLRDHIPTDSPDPVVIATAQELDCVLVSLNGDFADILTYPPV